MLTPPLTQQDHFPRSFMDSQLSDRHWAWIRDPFLMWQGGWREDGAMEGPGCLVFHGHTIPRKADHLHLVDREDLRGVLDRSATNARICLDGGAARGTSVAGALIEPDGITLLVSPVQDLLP